MYSIFSLPKGKPRNYFALHKNLLKMLGISLFNNRESKFYRIYAVIFLFFTSFTYPFVQLSETFKFYNNFDILSIVFAYGSVTLLGTLKASVVLYNRKSIVKSLDSLEHGIFEVNLEEGSPGVLMIKKCVQLTNRQSLLYFAAVSMTVVFGIIDAAMKRLQHSDYRKWVFPVGYFSLFDVTRSPNFEIVCFYQTVSVVLCFAVAALVDTLIAGVLAHIATQFKILQHRVGLLIENAHKLMLQVEDHNLHYSANSKFINPSTIPWKYLRATLKFCVKNHIAIINLAKTFEDIFSYLILIQFISSSASMCCAMYYCTLYPVTDIKFTEYLIGAVDMAFQVLLYCYWGNEVFLQSWAVSDACNKLNFVGTDVRFQKGLQLIILRSQRPVVLTAGKFSPLSLSTYVWIIRAAYSYYMAIISQS